MQFLRAKPAAPPARTTDPAPVPQNPNHSEAVVRNPGAAAVLSFIIPGLGQIYNGTWWRALFWLVFTPGLWIGSGGLLGWIAHVLSAVTAYNYARRHPHDELD